MGEVVVVVGVVVEGVEVVVDEVLVLVVLEKVSGVVVEGVELEELGKVVEGVVDVEGVKEA